MIEYDVSKFPWYWRFFRAFQKFWCLIGLHIPMKCESPESPDFDEYWCQECCTPVTKKEWDRFFSKARKVTKIV